jgi:hypothetical protein
VGKKEKWGGEEGQKEVWKNEKGVGKKKKEVGRKKEGKQ